MADATDLAVLLGLGIGAYYLYSTGFLNNIIQDPRLPTTVSQQTGMTEEMYYDDGSSAEGMMPPPFDQQGQPNQQVYFPPNMMPQQQPYNPMNYQYLNGQVGLNPHTSVGPPPGLISSIQPMITPQGPPYISGTVNTYSQYSPYNQFNAYQQVQTQPWGVLSTYPDDNIAFSDIDTSRFGCSSCKHYCSRNPYGLACRSCRPTCKKASHQYIPPQTGWTIGPVQRPTAGVYLGQIADILTGGATFAEMDDYSEKRRFDCHNHLKRPVRGKDNRFVTDEDYMYDEDRFIFNVE